MTEQYLSTSRLGNVIQLIALGNRTGILKVMRGLGSTREQGEIHFVNGQPSFALLGQLLGQAALSVLQNWGESQYLFLEGALPQQADRPSHDGDQISRPGEPAPPAQGGFGPRLVPRTPHLPGRPFPSAPTTAPLSMPPTGPTSGFTGRGMTGNLSRNTSGNMPSGPISTPPMRHEPLQGHFVPRRTASMDRLDTLPLDRRERMVLLLIDGHRSVADLTRLTRRSEQEVQLLLSHLISLGLIE